MKQKKTETLNIRRAGGVAPFQIVGKMRNRSCSQKIFQEDASQLYRFLVAHLPMGTLQPLAELFKKFAGESQAERNWKALVDLVQKVK